MFGNTYRRTPTRSAWGNVQKEESAPTAMSELGKVAAADAELWAILASPPDRQSIDVILAIVEFAKAIGIDAAQELLVRHPEIADLRPNLSQEFHAYVADLEVAEARRLLDMDIAAPVSYRDFASPASKAMFDRLDGLAARVAKPDMQRIVMVGCGWRPVTMFHLHECTDAREVIGLDVISDAVKTAAALSTKFGYGRIRIEHCDGVSFDYSGADLVYVASMVSPKTSVIDRILETAPEHVQIVSWEPVALGRLWVESGELDRNPYLEITGRSEIRRLSQDVYARRRRAAPSTVAVKR